VGEGLLLQGHNLVMQPYKNTYCAMELEDPFC